MCACSSIREDAPPSLDSFPSLFFGSIPTSDSAGWVVPQPDNDYDHQTLHLVHELDLVFTNPALLLSLPPAPTYTSALDAGGSTKSTILAK